jgi:hypothetical protein
MTAPMQRVTVRLREATARLGPRPCGCAATGHGSKAHPYPADTQPGGSRASPHGGAELPHGSSRRRCAALIAPEPDPTPPPVSATPEPQAKTPPGPPPLSARWFRENLDRYLPISLDGKPLPSGLFPAFQRDAGQGHALGAANSPTPGADMHTSFVNFINECVLYDVDTRNRTLADVMHSASLKHLANADLFRSSKGV